MRAVYALPLIFILVARGLWACGAALGWLAARGLPGRFFAQRAFVPLAAGVLLPVLLVWHAASDATTYFVTWAQAERTQRIYNADFRAAVPFVDSPVSYTHLTLPTNR